MSVATGPVGLKWVYFRKPEMMGRIRSLTMAVRFSLPATFSTTSISSTPSRVIRAPFTIAFSMCASSLGTPLTEMNCGSNPESSATASSPGEYMSHPQPSSAMIFWMACDQLALAAGITFTGPSVHPASKLCLYLLMLRLSWSSDTRKTGEPYSLASSTVSHSSMKR